MATTEQFSLRWNNFHSNLTNGFHELLEAADMVDVTLAVDGHVLQAHKIVLSICSPYFKQMFKVNPCKHPIVILRDVAHENMKDILEFMYMGEVSVLRDNLSAFLRTAELLQVKGLTGDDSSDTSSRKDDHLDCDIEEEEDQTHPYNQIMEQEMADAVQQQQSTPVHYPTAPKISVPPSQSLMASTKRQSKSTNSSPVQPTKRTKSEAASNKRQASTPEEPPTAKPKLEHSSPESSDCHNASACLDRSDLDDKETLKLVWENNVAPSSNETSTPDQGSKLVKINLKDLTPKQTYQCEKCWKRFSRRDHLRTHEKNIHGEDAGPFVCAICSQLYKNTESLRKHIAKFHFPKDQANGTQPCQKEIKVEN